MKKVKYYILDVFTNQRFGGNQLAVIPDASEISDELMQQIAFEFNYSETTFVLPPENSENDVRLRIFTPGKEIPTAGHPTIGTAYALLNLERLITLNDNKLVMEQLIGNIEVGYEQKGDMFTNIIMHQPLPVFGERFHDNTIIAEVLGIQPNEIMGDLPVQAVSCGNNFLYVPLTSSDAIKRARINHSKLEEYKEVLPSTEFYIFTFDTNYEDSTVHSRMYAPLFGIHEDPATGSASGPLGCYLVEHGKHDGKGIICEQGFEMNRPGLIYVDIEKFDNKITGVIVGGESILVAKGELYPETPHNAHNFISAVLNKL